jgi:hypothetical protein
LPSPASQRRRSAEQVSDVAIGIVMMTRSELTFLWSSCRNAKLPVRPKTCPYCPTLMKERCMSTITDSIDVNVDLTTAYNQWTQFVSFP